MFSRFPYTDFKFRCDSFGRRSYSAACCAALKHPNPESCLCVCLDLPIASPRPVTTTRSDTNACWNNLWQLYSVVIEAMDARSICRFVEANSVRFVRTIVWFVWSIFGDCSILNPALLKCVSTNKLVNPSGIGEIHWEWQIIVTGRVLKFSER